MAQALLDQRNFTLADYHRLALLTHRMDHDQFDYDIKHIRKGKFVDLTKDEEPQYSPAEPEQKQCLHCQGRGWVSVFE